MTWLTGLHGLINTAKLAPWSQNSWAPSITSRLEADAKTHFYLYYSNSGIGSAVLTSTSPAGPWSDPLGKNIVDRSVPGVDCEAPFDPGVLIEAFSAASSGRLGFFTLRS